MRKIFAKTVLAFFIAFFGIAPANASFLVTPVKQYELLQKDSTYSAWYLSHRNELAKEYNGRLYTSNEYQKHFELWLRVEGLTPKTVPLNSNEILTVPVSGQLAKQANHYFIWSDSGESIPGTIVVEGVTYKKSSEFGAEKLYTVIPTVVTTNVPVLPATKKEITALKKSAPEITAAETKVPAVVSTQTDSIVEKERFPMTETVFAFITISLLAAFGYVKTDNRKLKEEIIEKNKEIQSLTELLESHKVALAQTSEEKESMQNKATELEDVVNHTLQTFTIENETLLLAVLRAKFFSVHNGNKIYLQITEAGTKVLFPDGDVVLRKNKNIVDHLKLMHKAYLEPQALAA